MLVVIERVGWWLVPTAAPVITCVANNSEEPGTPISTDEGSEVSKGSQGRLLHHVFRNVCIAHQPARQPMSSIEMRKDDGVKALSKYKRHGRSIQAINGCHVASVLCRTRRRPPTTPPQDSYNGRTSHAGSLGINVSGEGGGVYCRSKNITWWTVLPCASRPVIVVVRLLPSAATTIRRVVITCPFVLLTTSYVRSSILFHEIVP